MKRKVLIIDDEPGFTKIVKLTLEAQKKYEVREVNNPNRALQDARDYSPDVIILDVIMPELDGGDVLTLLKADPVLKHVPVIFVTATVLKSEVGEHGKTLGGLFFVAKPVTASGLMECIEEHIKD
jgi:CheY-like chemotaxis protein